MLDLHIEGSGPVTLLVRDESRSTRSTSGCMEDDRSNHGISDENIAKIEDKCVRHVNNIQQVLGSTIGDESFDTLSMIQERKRRRRKHSQTRKNNKKKLKSDHDSKGKLEDSMSLSSSKSSLFLDSFPSESEKGDDIDKFSSSSDESKHENIKLEVGRIGIWELPSSITRYHYRDPMQFKSQIVKMIQTLGLNAMPMEQTGIGFVVVILNFGKTGRFIFESNQLMDKYSLTR